MSRDGTVLLASSGELYRMPGHVRMTNCTFDDHLVPTRQGQTQFRLPGDPLARTLSPDGRMIATALEGGGIVLEPVSACSEGRRRIDAEITGVGPDGTHPSRSIAFSPDGTVLAGITSTDGQTVTVWALSTGKVLRSGHCSASGCRTVEFSPDGRRILAADADGTARLFDARTGTLVRVFRGHGQAVNDARFLPDGERIITASADGTARLWSLADGQALQILAGHTDGVAAVAVSGDGSAAFTVSFDHTIRRWRTAGPSKQDIFAAGVGDVRGLAFSAEGKDLATGSEDRLEVFDLATGTALLDASQREVQALAFSKDDRHLAVGTTFGSWVLDVATGRRLWSLGASGDGLPYYANVAYTGDGKTLLASEGDGAPRLWDAATGVSTRTITGAGGFSTISPDGSSVAYSSSVLCGQVVIADARTGIPQRYINVTTGGGSGLRGFCAVDLAFTPDAKTLVTADSGHGPRLWNVSDATVIRDYPQPGTAWTVRVSPDGRYLLSNSPDGNARLFDIATGQLVRLFPSSGGLSINGLAFAMDGSLIALGGDNGSVVVTPLTIDALEAEVCGRLLRDLTAQERTDYGIDGTAPTCP